MGKQFHLFPSPINDQLEKNWNTYEKKVCFPYNANSSYKSRRKKANDFSHLKKKIG